MFCVCCCKTCCRRRCGQAQAQERSFRPRNVPCQWYGHLGTSTRARERACCSAFNLPYKKGAVFASVVFCRYISDAYAGAPPPFWDIDRIFPLYTNHLGRERQCPAWCMVPVPMPMYARLSGVRGCPGRKAKEADTKVHVVPPPPDASAGCWQGAIPSKTRCRHTFLIR